MTAVLERLAKWATRAAQKPGYADRADIQPDFAKDGRGKRLIFVAHCMLNQNARDEGSADFPAMMKPLLDVLAAKDIGIVQLPCPELMVLGLRRGRQALPSRTIRGRLEMEESQVRLKHLVDQVVYQIKEYQAQGFQVIGILGKNESPTCGVRTTLQMRVRGEAEGVFIRLLRQGLKAEGLDVGVQGIDGHCQQLAIDWVLTRI